MPAQVPKQLSGWDASTPRGRYAIREATRYMALRGRAYSDDARRLVKHLSTLALDSVGPIRLSSAAKFQRAVEAITADLMLSCAVSVWARRSFNNNDFRAADDGVGRTSFLRAWDAFEALGWGISFDGFRAHEQGGFGGSEIVWGGQKCLAPTSFLTDLAARSGAPVDNAILHFTAGRVTSPDPIVIVRGRSTKDDEGRRKGGQTLAVDMASPKPASILTRLETINAYLSTDRISGFAFGGLRRIFNNGDVPGFDWQWGGRFYSVTGADPYEHWKGGKARRAASILIDRHAVAEVDISASHLTILSVLAGEPISPAGDPYALSGVGNREAVKRWITIALGRGSFDRTGRWYARVRDAALSQYPFLFSLERDGVTTLDLQFHESEILSLALERLRDRHDVAALPIHDGLIVAGQHVEVARTVLAGAFQDYLRGVTGHRVTTEPRIH